MCPRGNHSDYETTAVPPRHGATTWYMQVPPVCAGKMFGLAQSMSLLFVWMVRPAKFVAWPIRTPAAPSIRLIRLKDTAMRAGWGVRWDGLMSKSTGRLDLNRRLPVLQLSLSLRVPIFTVATPRSSYWIIAAGEQDPLHVACHSHRFRGAHSTWRQARDRNSMLPFVRSQEWRMYYNM